ISRSRMVEFLIGSCSSGGFWHPDLRDDLVWAQAGGEHAAEKLTRRDHALALAAEGDNIRVQSQNGGGIIRCRMGSGQAASNCAPIAHLHIANFMCCLRQKR